MKEISKFPNDVLGVPLQVIITVSSDYKSLKTTSNNNSVAVGIIVSLLIIVAVVALAWKLKKNEKNLGCQLLFTS